MFNVIFLATDIAVWLLEQAPVIVVMGAVIYWLQGKLNKAEEDKDSLAKDVIKLTTLWEEKSSEIDQNGIKAKEQILELLRDIKTLVLNK